MWITIYGEKVVDGKHGLSMSLCQKLGKNRYARMICTYNKGKQNAIHWKHLFKRITLVFFLITHISNVLSLSHMSSNSTLAGYIYFENIENLIDFYFYFPIKNANKK